MNEAINSRRIVLIDVVRGAALIAMMIFHSGWDISYFRLIRFDPADSLGWTLFARSVAGTFLFLVGVSLVLSTRNGFRLRPYLRRLAMVAAAAALVSVATYFALPEGWVFFGILHQITLASVLALPFLKWPPPLTLLFAAVFLAIPQVYRSDIFDHAALWWVGLTPEPPVSFDYVPLFPWFAAVLAGVGVARIAVARGWDSRLAGWHPSHRIGRLLAFGGRHSLVVYLVHQPVLFGLFFLVAHFAMPNAAIDSARADCADRCVLLGNPSAGCHAYCGCVFDDMKTAGLTAPFLDNSITPEQTEQLRGLASVCTAKTLPVAPPAPETGDTPPTDQTGETQ